MYECKEHFKKSLLHLYSLSFVLSILIVFRLTQVLTSEIDFWAKTQQLDFLKSQFAARMRHLRSTWDLCIRVFDKAHPTVQGTKHHYHYLGSYCSKIEEIYPKTFLHGTVGCVSSKALIRRSQVLLKCLSLTENWFFRKSSCCVFAQKLISLVKICVDRDRSKY